MKSKLHFQKFIFLSLAVFLSSCYTNPDSSTLPARGSSNTSIGPTSTTSGDVPTSTSGTTSTPSGKQVTLNIFATNDIHGQIDPEDPSSYDGRLGLAKTMTFLKDKKDHEKNVLLLDQGDTWQGSIYSNINHGELITDVMNYVHYDARTIGNHDFDWGPEYIKKNTAKKNNGYATPVLGANIYDYNFDTKTQGTIQQADLGTPSVTYTIDGLKVGIIGTIGQKQITSINSLYMHDLCFKNHIETIKSESTKLRNEGCHVIISSTHAGQEDLINYNLGNYVDLVLCAHTHRKETYQEGDLYFAQFGAYTEAIGFINLTYNFDTQKVTTSISSFSSAQINSEVKEIEPTIQSIMDSYHQEAIDEGANTVVANNVSGYFNSGSTGANLLAKAVFDEAINEGYDVDFSYVNNLRHDLTGPTLTYANIYEAVPFDNMVYIIDVSLKEIKDELIGYNYICKSDGVIALEDRTYKVACLDYLAFHTNEARNYDYFPSMANKDISKIPHLTNNYRTILKNYLVNNDYDKGKQLSSSDYYSSVSIFNKNELVFPLIELVLNFNYDNIRQTINVDFGVNAGNVLPKIERDEYTFDGWYFEKECTNKVEYYYSIVTKTEVFAKWKALDDDVFETGDLTYQYFADGSTQTFVTATSGKGEQLNLEFDTSPIVINESYREFGIQAGGFVHLVATYGYKITFFEAAQYKYSNLAFYDDDYDEPTSRLSVTVTDSSYDYSSVKVHTFEGEANQIYVKNTYSGLINLKYIKVGLKKV